MADMTIEKLSLRLSGLSEDDSQHLARLITEGLAAVAMPLEAATGRVDTLQVNATAHPGASMDELARQIVADVLRQITRTLS